MYDKHLHLPKIRRIKPLGVLLFSKAPRKSLNKNKQAQKMKEKCTKSKIHLVFGWVKINVVIVGGEKIGGEGSWGQVFWVFRFRFPHCPLIESFVAAKLGKSEREMANGKWKTGEMRKMERRPTAAKFGFGITCAEKYTYRKYFNIYLKFADHG